MINCRRILYLNFLRCLLQIAGMTLVIILNGVDSLKSVEVVDINFQKSVCELVTDFPIAVHGAMGGLLNHSIPLICGGGEPPTSACYQWLKDGWIAGSFKIIIIKNLSIKLKTDLSLRHQLLMFFLSPFLDLG